MAVPFSWMISGTPLLLSNCILMRPDQRGTVLSLALASSSALLRISGNPSILPFSNYFLLPSQCVFGVLRWLTDVSCLSLITLRWSVLSINRHPNTN